MKWFRPEKHRDWLVPHSLKWYKQLELFDQAYRYPWNSVLDIPNGETIFDGEVLQLVQNQNVLDVGCGHGEFTLQCSTFAKEVTGFDVTDGFLPRDDIGKFQNTAFVSGNVREGLPFPTNQFDIAYNRKGPTSSYGEMQRVVKSGGTVLGFHPGDETAKQLVEYFPGLFYMNQGTPILDKIQQRLENSMLSNIEISTVNSFEYLQAPSDVLKLQCFGQTPEILALSKSENLSSVSRLFNQYAHEKGLPITFSRYLVRANA